MALFTNLRTAKRNFISKRARQRRKKRTNDFRNVIFAKGFAKVTGKKAKTRFQPRIKLFCLLKFFQTRFSEIFS